MAYLCLVRRQATIMQLKTIDCVDNAYVASITKQDSDGEVTYEFSVTVNYVPMMQDPAAATDGADDAQTTEAETDTEAE